MAGHDGAAVPIGLADALRLLATTSHGLAVVAADNSAERSDQPRLNAGSLRSLRAISNRVASQSNCSGAANMSRIT